MLVVVMMNMGMIPAILMLHASNNDNYEDDFYDDDEDSNDKTKKNANKYNDGNGDETKTMTITQWNVQKAD